MKPDGGYDPEAVLATERRKKPWWLMPCGCDHRNNAWYRFHGMPDPNWPPQLKKAALGELQATPARVVDDF